jgi:hypothetical protein
MQQRGWTRLSTPLNTVRIQPNGGLAPLEITEPMAPHYLYYEGKLSGRDWESIRLIVKAAMPCGAKTSATLALDQLKPVPDTAAIRAALKAGEEVPGAVLKERGVSLRLS